MKTLARERDKAEVLERLRAVRSDSARRWGRMSAHQMVCHLADGFRMATGELPVRRAGGAFARTILKWIVLYVPVRWPPGIATSPEVDQERQGTRPEDFAADVAHVEALVEMVTAGRTRAWQPHPLFGRMSSTAWLRWGDLHMDHHLRQFGA
jgi:hypothetical protein